MAINFFSLEDAALKLGVSTDELVEMRSRGEIFGYRDGTSWKFKPEEIERVMAEMQGDVLDGDEYGEGSSLLVSDSSSSKSGSTIGGDKRGGNSDLRLADDSDDDSDVSLVADPGSGSDVKLVAGRSGLTSDGKKPPKSNDDDLQLIDDSGEGSDVPLSMAGESGLELTGNDGSDVLAGSDLDLGLEDLSSGGSNNVHGGGSKSAIGSSGNLDLDDGDLELADDDDLVLGGGGSDLALATDSGINLMSPSDSGISLEDVPLDLAGSGISGLSLGSEPGPASGSGSGSGSFVDFQQDEEFQLSPSGDMEMDDDSSSQVIELEDSTEFGDAAVALPADDGGFGAMDAGGDAFGVAGPSDGSMLETGRSAAPVVAGTPEVPFATSQVLLLLTSLLVMCMSGILVTDIVRNMWAWSGTSDLTSGFTDLVTSSLGMK